MKRKILSLLMILGISSFCFAEIQWGNSSIKNGAIGVSKINSTNTITFSNGILTGNANTDTMSWFEIMDGNGNLEISNAFFPAGGGTGNVGFGSMVMQFDTTGYSNTGIGNGAIRNNTTGSFNTGIGAGSLDSNSTGAHNTGVGNASLTFNTIGAYNTAVGDSSLQANGSGGNNTAVGDNALYSSTGNFNTGIGVGTLKANIGSNNTALGSIAGNTNANGSNDLFLGYDAGYYSTTGNEFYLDTLDRGTDAASQTKGLMYGTFNVTPSLQTLSLNANVTIPYGLTVSGNITAGSITGKIGVSNLKSTNTITANNEILSGNTGIDTMTWFKIMDNSTYHNFEISESFYPALTSGSRNTGFGSDVLQYDTSGSYNTAVGRGSLKSNTSGNYNTALGWYTLSDVYTGNYNTALGYDAGDTNNGSNSLFIGSTAGNWSTASNTFYLDTLTRGSDVSAQDSGLMYGTFNTTPASQTLRLNANVTVPYSLTVNGTITGTTTGNLKTSPVRTISTITVGTSPFVYQNITGYPESIIVNGGAVSDNSFSRDNITYHSIGQTNGMFWLDNNDYLKVTYSTAPTMTAVPH